MTSGSVSQPAPAASSSVGLRRSSRSVRSKRDQHRPFELDHDVIVLVEAARADGDNADPGARLRLALLENLRFRPDRVAAEDRRGEPDVPPAEVDGALRDV